jgi:hypothetical protein
MTRREKNVIFWGGIVIAAALASLPFVLGVFRG